MSIQPTPLDPALMQYISENFSSEDEFLKHLREEATNEGIPEICISPEQGAFLQFLLTATNAKNILEIGTLAGYSAITMAKILPKDSKLFTIEYEYIHATFAARKVKEAGLDDIIEIQNSDAKIFLKEFQPENQFDFVFVDADKPSYAKYLDLVTPMLKVGGIFAADNAFAFGFITSSAPERNPEDVKSIKAFNNYFRNHPDYRVCIVPVGDGMIMGVKIR
jgi:caffeoyl-CoA O-methyltransferase